MHIRIWHRQTNMYKQITVQRLAKYFSSAPIMEEVVAHRNSFVQYAKQYK
ncbi:hypothetical protein [Brevibacillus choshinensis]|nr:hypothetical protein [Brevibacillus choshinensis]